VDTLLDRLQELKNEAEEYSEEEGKRRFESIETQATECKSTDRHSLDWGPSNCFFGLCLDCWLSAYMDILRCGFPQFMFKMNLSGVSK